MKGKLKPQLTEESCAYSVTSMLNLLLTLRGKQRLGFDARHHGDLASALEFVHDGMQVVESFIYR